MALHWPTCHTQALALVGEFNNWQPKEGHWARKNQFGTWELFLPDKPDGMPTITHRFVRCLGHVWRAARGGRSTECG